MAMTDPEGRPNGPLARVGQSDSFAGLTRIGIVLFGAIMAALFYWGEQDIGSVLRDVRNNQEAIIAIRDRTTRLEDSAASTSSANRDFREWTIGRVNDLTSQMNADGQRINDIDRAQGKTSSRVLCLENKTRCPQ